MSLTGSIGRWHGSATTDERVYLTRKITDQESVIADLRVKILQTQRDLKAAQRELYRLQHRHDCLPAR